MGISNKKFNKIKGKAEEFYKSIGQVYCPYFKEEVSFNSKGLDHLKMRGWNRSRARKDQYMRLRLIHLAPKVIRLSNTLQGISEIREFVRKKINNRWEKVLTNVVYYEYIAILEGIRIRIVVKTVLGGQKIFWSIIPYWRMDRQRNKRLLTEGRPETD